MDFVLADILNKIFDKFFRVPGSPTGGTGLGLSIVKSIIELHKGQIHVHNIQPHGLCFTIEFLLENQPQAPGEI
jgi:signal transduction histidine kinase